MNYICSASPVNLRGAREKNLDSKETVLYDSVYISFKQAKPTYVQIQAGGKVSGNGKREL